jgi:pectate lyase
MIATAFAEGELAPRRGRWADDRCECAKSVIRRARLRDSLRLFLERENVRATPEPSSIETRPDVPLAAMGAGESVLHRAGIRSVRKRCALERNLIERNSASSYRLILSPHPIASSYRLILSPHPIASSYRLILSPHPIDLSLAMTVLGEGLGEGKRPSTDPKPQISKASCMTGLFRHLTAFSLMASAAGCTLTADEYAPAFASTNDPPRTPCGDDNCDTEQVTTSGSAPVASTSGGGSGDLTNRVTEAPGMGVPLADDAADEVVGAGPPGATELEPSVDGGAPRAALLPRVVGWAGVAGLGLETTTGGGAAPPILVQTAEELIDLAARPEPLTLAIAGSLDVGRLELASDKTLYGLSDSATLRGGIGIGSAAGDVVRNVIVHNLRVDASTSTLEGDGVQIRYAHHVWIDHCEIRDAADGLMEIVHGSDFVTVSHTRFRYAASDRAGRIAALVGHDAGNAAEDRGHLNVTWLYNWWSDNVPRALVGRFGSLHLFNNLFASPGNEDVLNADVSAQFLVENNVFVGVASPHAVSPDSSAVLQASGNAYVETMGARDVRGTAAVPPYEYSLDSVVAALITGEAGPRDP